MPTHLTFDEHLTALPGAAERLREAAAGAGLDAPVPTCPEWRVRDLVTHQGMIHRWAAANLRVDRGHRTGDSEAEARAATDLLGWFTDGVEALVAALHDTAEDAEALVFLHDAPPPRRFWARRQAHETTIHSADAVAAALGRPPRAADLTIDPALAADGIDELLCGFITRGGRLTQPEPAVLEVRVKDTGHAWSVRIDDAGATTVTGPAERPDATVTGTAAEVYLGLWNRSDSLDVTGRVDLLDLWRAKAQVRWGG